MGPEKKYQNNLNSTAHRNTAFATTGLNFSKRQLKACFYRSGVVGFFVFCRLLLEIETEGSAYNPVRHVVIMLSLLLVTYVVTFFRLSCNFCCTFPPSTSKYTSTSFLLLFWG